MIDSEERAARQRSFYLKLAPAIGQQLATAMGGFVPPGEDGQEEELKEALELWFKAQNSGAAAILADAAWWMTKFQDRMGRMSRAEAVARTDELQSYAIAALGLLMEKGIVQFTKEPEIPKLVKSTHDPINRDIEQAILDRLAASMKEKKDEQ